MKTHRPLIFVTIFLCLGIISNYYFKMPFRFLAMADFCAAVFALLFFNKKIISMGMIYLTFFLTGAVLSQQCQILPEDHIAYVAKYYKRKAVSLEGVVVSDVQKRDFFNKKKTSFALEVKNLKTPWGWRKKTGKILVNIFRDLDISYGDRLLLEGKLYRPFNFQGTQKFSYRDYLHRKQIELLFSVKKDGIVSVLGISEGNSLKELSLRLRDRLKRIFTERLSLSEAALMQAMILGGRLDIPKHINELFVQTGTAHILAISGFNVGIVTFLIFLVLKAIPIGRKNRYILTMVFIIFYAFLTGAQPSVVRATIMAVIFLASYLVEREADLINSLCLAALVILAVNPLNLFDVGFQLSFISVLAILLIYPKIFAGLTRRMPHLKSRAMTVSLELISVSLAAWLGVAGLIAYYFDIATPVTLAANLFIVPLSTVITALGLGLLAMGLLWPAGAFVFVACLKLMINVMIGCIFLFAQLPGAYFYLKNVSCWHMIGYYLLLALLGAVLFVIRLTKKRKYDTVNPMKKIIIFFLIFSFLAFSKAAFAFWVWTPETNRWINPKYAVKDTPQEQLAYAMDFYKSKDYKKAADELNKLIRNYSRAKEAADAQFYLGVILEDQGRFYEAHKAYQKVIEKYPFSNRTPEVVERQYRIGERLMEGQEQKNQFVSTLVGNEYSIIDIFRAVIKNASYGKYAAPSQYKIGLYLQGKGLYQEARDEFEKVINDYPDSEWVKAARYQIALVDAKRSGKSQYDQKVTQAAVEEFKEFAKIYPDAELSQKAQNQINQLKEKEAESNFLIARFYEKQKNYQSARIYYHAVIDNFQGSQWVQEAVKKLQELDLKESKNQRK